MVPYHDVHNAPYPGPACFSGAMPPPSNSTELLMVPVAGHGVSPNSAFAMASSSAKMLVKDPVFHPITGTQKFSVPK